MFLPASSGYFFGDLTEMLYFPQPFSLFKSETLTLAEVGHLLEGLPMFLVFPFVDNGSYCALLKSEKPYKWLCSACRFKDVNNFIIFS